MSPRNKIAVKALLWVERNEKELLVFKAYDKVKKDCYYRFLGGTVEFREHSSTTLKREIKEEIGSEIKIGALLDVIENIFELDGDPYHEIVFIYTGKLLDESLYEKDEFTLVEDSGTVFDCAWIKKLVFVNEEKRLVPEGLLRHL